MRDLIVTDYSWFLETFDNYSNKINRIDASRFFVLHKYGGIYVDLDFVVLRKLNIVDDKINIVESPYKHNENLQNALMSSPKGCPLWNRVFKQLLINKKYTGSDIQSILSCAGPKLLDDCFNKKNGLLNEIHVLPKDEYNPSIYKMSTCSNHIRSIHMLTSFYSGGNTNMHRPLFLI